MCTLLHCVWYLYMCTILHKCTAGSFIVRIQLANTHTESLTFALLELRASLQLKTIPMIRMLMQFSILAVFNTRSNAAVISSYRRSDCREGSGIGLLTNQDSGPISSILHPTTSMTGHKNLINFPQETKGR